MAVSRRQAPPPLRVVVLDSGYGGLSVAQPLFEQLSPLHANDGDDGGRPVELVYYDARPSSQHGYNALPDLDARIACFSEVLTRMHRQLQPELVAIACNTLSVIAERTQFAATAGGPLLRSIVASAVSEVVEWWQQHLEQTVTIFGTVTTIESGVYAQQLADQGIPRRLIHSYACENLPTVLESDAFGTAPHPLFQSWLEQAAKTHHPGGLVLLACTHFGLKPAAVAAQFRYSQLRDACVFNPNDRFVRQIKAEVQAHPQLLQALRQRRPRFCLQHFVPQQQPLSAAVRQLLASHNVEY